MADYYSLIISVGTYGLDSGPSVYETRYYSSREKAIAAREFLLFGHNEYDGIIRLADSIDIQLIRKHPHRLDDMVPLHVVGLVVLTVRKDDNGTRYCEFDVRLGEMDRCHTLIYELIKGNADFSVSRRKAIIFDRTNEIQIVEDVVNTVKEIIKEINH